MAKSCVYIFINGLEVRCFGGNGSDVKRERIKYLNMTKEEFLEAHPRWSDEVKKNGYQLRVGGADNKYWEGKCKVNLYGVDTPSRVTRVEES